MLAIYQNMIIMESYSNKTKRKNKMNRLTTLNGKTHKTWLNNRLKSGKIIAEEINYKHANPEDKKIKITDAILDLLKVYESDNNKIDGWIGTSFNYRFYIV